jgi:hypothetical protein
VVVADDEVDAAATGVRHLLHGLDAAVERHHKSKTIIGRKINGFLRDAVALGVAVGDVVAQTLGAKQGREVAHHRGHGGDAIHVVIAQHQHLFAALKGFNQAGHGVVHAAHQQRIGQTAQVGVKEFSGSFGRVKATLHQQGGYFRSNEEGLRQAVRQGRVGFGDIIPPLNRGYGHRILRQNGPKSTTKPRRFPVGVPLGRPSPSAMRKLQDFYRQYRQYIGTDALMYGTFILVLALMFVFFG